MAEPREFDLLNSPLTGKNLLEASAGTGKTYTIAGLFLRLLVEKNIPVDRILVVTFTVAATNELKDRIHANLEAAREAFLQDKSEDQFLSAFVKKTGDHDTAVKTLTTALQNFDEAAVLTIHTFCNRVLQENAFESGGLFDPVMVTEQTTLLRQAVQDFWRKHVYLASPLFLRFALSQLDPDKLFDLVKDKVGTPFLRLLPDIKDIDTRHEEAAFEGSFSDLQNLWSVHKTEIRKRLLDKNSGLSGNKYNRKKLPTWLEQLDAYLAASAASPDLFKEFVKFTASALADGANKGALPLKHQFFEVCETHQKNHEALLEKYEQRLMSLKIKAFHFVREELAKRKRERNILYFDDLLTNLHAALRQDGEALARTVCAQYSAALIDEFQDTDPLQYDIFKRIFDRDEVPFFLIGDPKQAIYGFRGADIFAYLRAKQETRPENHYTLSRNYRSTPELIAATNTVFGQAKNQFVFEEIPFRPAVAAPNNPNVEHLHISGKTEAPFQLWYVDAGARTDGGKALNKDEATSLILDAVASEIARLLLLARQGSAKFDGRPLKESDIAVLVRTNLQAIDMQAALLRCNIHSVLYSTSDLFTSDEATELARVLEALSEPRRQSLLKAALATDLFGVSGNEIYNLTREDRAFEDWFDRFVAYHKLWQEHGFMRMFRELLSAEGVTKRLMSMPDGERRVTNLLHLAEILNAAESTKRLGISGLLKWLAEQMAPGNPTPEEHQLRLESDDNAVKLVTMHMSKGLQYPVVFCPFSWGSSELWRSKIPEFHDETPQRNFTLDLGSDQFDESKRLAEKELLAENLRLLYVAVTRARCRCYLVWGRFYNGSTSAPAYLFHQTPLADFDHIVSWLKTQVDCLNDSQMRQALEQVVTQAQGNVALVDLPEASSTSVPRALSQTETLAVRQFTRQVAASERIASYSSLVSGQPHGSELADHDDLPIARPLEVEETEEDKKAAFAHFLNFPHGAKTGVFVHLLLESLDYASLRRDRLEPAVAEKLNRFGYPPEWQSAVSDMIERVLQLPLPSGNGEFVLSGIKQSQRINEMEFYFPVKELSARRLRDVFAQHAGFSPYFQEKIRQLGFREFGGFMKGFIDLTFEFDGRFYIVDWKSNFLGNRLTDYNQQALQQAMEDNFYILQYHIYAVALCRYLKLRLPDFDYEKNFGGVFYIFLRGVEPARGPEFGLYQSRPQAEVIEKMTNLLGG